MEPRSYAIDARPGEVLEVGGELSCLDKSELPRPGSGYKYGDSDAAPSGRGCAYALQPKVLDRSSICQGLCVLFRQPPARLICSYCPFAC